LLPALLAAALNVTVWSEPPSVHAAAADAVGQIRGQVLGGGAPVANSTVTLWAASAGAPKQLAQARTGADGRFTLNAGAPGKDSSLYLIAKGGTPVANKAGGDNPAVSLMLVVGSRAPARVAINEMTTIASVITHNQYIDGNAIKGSALALRIAAGNVPNFVDLTTGDYGPTIADALNSAQTPTMANFATVTNVLAGCVTRVKADACAPVFAAAKGPAGSAPADTLAAAESIVRYPWYQPERIFALLEDFYPYPKTNEVVRPTPFIPYLTYAPSAWVFPLKFTGGGLGRGAHEDGAEWQAAFAGAQGLHRWRHRWPRLRTDPRRQRQCLGDELPGPDYLEVRQFGQGALAARGLELQRPARPDAGHHRCPEWRRLGPRHDEGASGSFSERRSSERPAVLSEQDGQSAQESL